jgi:CHAT domain-containing protein
MKPRLIILRATTDVAVTGIISRFVLFVALLSVAFAASSQVLPDRVRLLTSGRYADLERLVEKEIQGDPKPKSAKLLPLCIAYSRLKRYDKVSACLERLEANVNAGDHAANDLEEMDRNSPLMGGLARMGSIFMGGEKTLKGTVVPYMYLVRTEVLTELRDYEGALVAAPQCLKAITNIGPFEDRATRVSCLAALGVAQALSGRRTDAEGTATELEAIGTAYPYNGMKQAKWLGVVRIHAALGNFKKARQVFVDENPTAHGLFMSFAYGVGGAVSGLRQDESLTAWNDLPLEFLQYKVQLEVGEVKPAKEGFDKLLARPQTKDNGEIHWLLLNDRGRIAAQEGDLPAAIDFWRRAIEVIEEQRSTINTEASKIGFVGDKQAVYRALVGGLFAQARYAEAFDYVERSKARALVDMLAAKKDFAVAAPNADEIRKLLTDAETAESGSRAQLAQDETRVRSAGLASAVKALQEQAPELASLVSVSSASIAEIQALIPDDEALIEYYYDERGLYAFVLTREALQGASLEGDGLEADVRALRKALELPVESDHAELGAKLYARLIAPIEPLLGGRKKLVVVPHAALHYLPFAALRPAEGYLIDRYSLRLLPSASVVRYLRVTKPAAGRAGLLAFGNPDLDDPRMDLKFAQDEALAIAQKVPQSRALVRKEASETALRQYAAGFSYLHFATHGEFNAEAPMKSALLLARDERADGLLTVDKVYSLRFDSDLVTLSACETGLGKVANGDDVVGLTRGFLYAGAATVVASLWQVDDAATSTLMTRFYDELKSGDKREALRAAQIATREKYPHPFFWAAFQLTGQAN